MVDIIYRDELAKQEYFKNEPFVFDHEMDTGNSTRNGRLYFIQNP